VCEWVIDVASGIKDILTSKLDGAHRDPALYLSAILCQLFKLNWFRDTETKFLLLMVDLFAVVGNSQGIEMYISQPLCLYRKQE